jgi:transmembrane sensor
MSIDRIYEEAAGWLVRQQDDAMDWEGFTLWLEADPRHRAAYDDLALLDADLDTFAQRF